MIVEGFLQITVKRKLPMISLSCEKLTYSIADNIILGDLSFSINDGDKLGIVGVNGAGKSTLFKLIAGEYTPSSGNVYRDKSKRLGMLAQNTVISGDDTLIEEVLLGAFSDLLQKEKQLEELRAKIEQGETDLAQALATEEEAFSKNGGYSFRSRAQGILVSLGFPVSLHNNRISTLSGGQKTRIALAALLLSEPDILLLDEPTNHLDMSTLVWLEDFLRSYTKTLLVISHDRYFLDRVTTHILDIENTHAKLYTGNYSTFAEKKKKDREVELHHYKNQQREIKRIEDYITQQRRWNRERNIIAAESRQKQLDKMVKLQKPENEPTKLRFSFRNYGIGANEVLTVRNLKKVYDEKELFSDLSFTVMRENHLFITGDNGCGKSTLIKIIANRLNPDNGSVYWGANTKFAYYDQENQNLKEENTVLDELWDAYPELSHTEVRNALAVFLFRGEDVLKPVSVLSGGEKARLTLAKIMLSEMNVLILDEPTNHLDINSREALEDALLDFEGTIIAVSHDRYFISKLANRILYFRSGNKTPCDYKGSYAEYLLYSEGRQNGCPAPEPKKTTAAKSDYLNAKKEQAEQRKRKRVYENAQKTSEDLEKKIELLNAKVKENETNHMLLAELFEQIEKCEEKLLEAYEITENYKETE